MARSRRQRAAAALACVLLLLPPGCTTLAVPEEEKIGRDASRELRRELDFVRDEWVVDYVEDIGRSIVAAAPPQPYEYHFYVVQDESLNAFALPAGHVARNYNRQRNTGIVYQLLSVVASIFVGGYAAAGGQMLGELAAVAYVNQFTREAEEEADAFAVEMLPKAGYDPNGLVTFFHTMTAQSDGGQGVPTFLASHPATDDRIRSTAALIADATLVSGLRVDDGGQLEIIQRRIQLLTRRADAL
jgi:predicted Zn-dependent protease